MIDWRQFKTEAEVVKFLRDTKGLDTTAAKKYMRTNIPLEPYYQDKIIKHIRALIPSAFVYKAAAGPYSRQGIPDVTAVINGRYYGFEVKRPLIGRLTKIQEQTIKEIKKAGGHAYKVVYPEEVTAILLKEGEITNEHNKH